MTKKTTGTEGAAHASRDRTRGHRGHGRISVSAKHMNDTKSEAPRAAQGGTWREMQRAEHGDREEHSHGQKAKQSGVQWLTQLERSAQRKGDREGQAGTVWVRENKSAAWARELAGAC